VPLIKRDWCNCPRCNGTGSIAITENDEEAE
jgi:hypothetical protein